MGEQITKGWTESKFFCHTLLEVDILHVWRENTMFYQTNKIGNFVFAFKDLFPLGK